MIGSLRVRSATPTLPVDPFRGYRNAIRDRLPDAVAVLDALHVVEPAGDARTEAQRMTADVPLFQA
ncbi:hypothetical protein [Streptomyces chiangmaiensis]|uniref:Transposase IS204/IS1001/IS1096/IS1165 DDE domain-containing protein n=1 Tax=Streptomyces chiangmaiensis TaxID=766497 RepID=A0ABU7FS59_9ACTN|nr:hypothetical protein [Streptomyces chiangmaiensis]MED7826741.1 hypothetical protein [Streptomyces chiangmaiensis]